MGPAPGRNAGAPAYVHARSCHHSHSIEPLAPIDHLLLRLVPRIEHWGGDVRAPLFPTDRTMPHAPAEGRDVDLIAIQWIGNHSVSPLEVKSGNADPMQPAVCRPPGRRFEASGVDHIRVLRIDGDVVNVAILIEHLLPVLAAILREKYPSAIAVLPGRSTPCSQAKRAGRHWTV